MTPRDRFNAWMHFQPVDHPPLWEWGPWGETHKAWLEQGMGPEGPTQFADCDPRADCGVSFHMEPWFEVQVIEEDDQYILYRNHEGILMRERKPAELSMPHFLDYPVKNRADFERLIAERYDPNDPRRYPADWDARVAAWKAGDAPLALSGDRVLSFFGHARGLMGPEAAMIAMHDDPAFIHDMMEFLADFFIAVARKALTEAPVDFVVMWEDMCYKTASLISPAMFREFMVPRYQKVTEFIRSHGVDVIMVDSDGQVGELIPLWLQGGVNCVYPMEVQSGMDVVALRKQYGHELLMHGGIDKRILTQDKAAIDRELEYRLSAMGDGGYIPSFDHSLPPDCRWDLFQYYWERKKRLYGMG
jgi:uroporphyrinogen decarboxylase